MAFVLITAIVHSIYAADVDYKLNVVNFLLMHMCECASLYAWRSIKPIESYLLSSALNFLCDRSHFTRKMTVGLCVLLSSVTSPLSFPLLLLLRLSGQKD